MIARERAMSRQFYAPLSTSIGWIGVLASDKGLRKLVLPKPSAEQVVEELWPETNDAELAPARFRRFQKQLEEYLSGDAMGFDLELDTEGYSDFFSKAWAACSSIPRGQTRSYSWLAAQAGRPRAIRAAGQAMARNPVPIVIPCHRVIGTDGKLHGYGGGLGLKKRLLELEQSDSV